MTMTETNEAASTDQAVEVFKAWVRSPRVFIRDAWGLTPQRDNAKFVKGKHFSWQQDDILIAVEEAIAQRKPNRISIAAGHGPGKTTTLSWLIIWFLICHPNSKVPCTAPTDEQMHDNLWAEIKVWLDKLPPSLRGKLEWTASHVRCVENPESWFARAKTAVKEKPEALAGIHAPFVFYVVDEASGVPDPIYKPIEGALTGTSDEALPMVFLIILISNPTRTMGYFYDTHHSDKMAWQTFQFDAKDSPIVDEKYVNRIIEKYGEDSDEYRIRVSGQFPREEAMDDKGYVPLLLEEHIHTTSDATMGYPRRLGVDPAGEGSDKAAWIERDAFKARVCASEKKSNSKGIASKTYTLMTGDSITEENVIVDSFGIGSETVKELALMRQDVRSINVGEAASEDDRFVNRRSEAYWRLREWCIKGGEIVFHEDLKRELLSIKFMRTTQGKIQIMPKKEMRKQGIPSPNFADALMLTFVDGSDIEDDVPEQEFPTEQYS